MKKLLLIVVLLSATPLLSQTIIKLPQDHPGEVLWAHEEKEYHSNLWQTTVVTNVSSPTLQAYLPEGDNNKKAAVIIAPGGGLYALSMLTEGVQVAEWLNKKEVAAFVLKYHLVPTGEDGVAELSRLSATNPKEILNQVNTVLPMSIQDGLNAVQHVRDNAAKYGIDPNKIGFMGFSAGGAVTMGVGYNYTKANRPNYLVPVYAWTAAQPVNPPKKDCPPMFIVCASNDPLGLAKGSVALYSSMLAANKNVAMMMYAKGGHGFGLKTQNLPSDTWIDRFYDWAKSESLIIAQDH